MVHQYQQEKWTKSERDERVRVSFRGSDAQKAEVLDEASRRGLLKVTRDSPAELRSDMLELMKQ